MKGGKLPGMHGGNMRCTGGQLKPNGDNCFSTRLMWGPGGRVEGYLYLPLNKQVSPRSYYTLLCSGGH